MAWVEKDHNDHLISTPCCVCSGINPRVKSGRFMKILPDYEHMEKNTTQSKSSISHANGLPKIPDSTQGQLRSLIDPSGKKHVKMKLHSLHYIESQNHLMAWVEKDHNAH